MNVIIEGNVKYKTQFQALYIVCGHKNVTPTYCDLERLVKRCRCDYCVKLNRN